MGTNPIVGFLRTLSFFATGRVRFDREAVGTVVTMEDGRRFRVFRHVTIRSRAPRPEAVFIVRFTPAHMSVAANIRFSRLPLLVFMGFRGFRAKYWCVDDATGMCQGVYAWQTRADAEAYERSFALRFMTRRSQPGSVSHEILDQSREPYWLFADDGSGRGAPLEADAGQAVDEPTPPTTAGRAPGSVTGRRAARAHPARLPDW